MGTYTNMSRLALFQMSKIIIFDLFLFEFLTLGFQDRNNKDSEDQCTESLPRNKKTVGITRRRCFDGIASSTAHFLTKIKKCWRITITNYTLDIVTIKTSVGGTSSSEE